jgi:hypothetical protein
MRFVLLDTVDDAVRTALVEPQRMAEVALAD